MAKTKEREQSFESSLATLEGIVAQLESGELPLERALELFEDGVGLARRCQTQLADAERKVEMLLRERGEIKVVPFEAPKENANDEAERSATPVAPSSLIVVPTRTKESEDKLDDSIPF
jgi:exodeoxyribonuclease VII small subunit